MSHEFFHGIGKEPRMVLDAHAREVFMYDWRLSNALDRYEYWRSNLTEKRNKRMKRTKKCVRMKTKRAALACCYCLLRYLLLFSLYWCCLLLSFSPSTSFSFSLTLLAAGSLCLRVVVGKNGSGVVWLLKEAQSKPTFRHAHVLACATMP